MHPILVNSLDQPLTCMQLSAEHVALDILHVGRVSNDLYSCFETTSMTFNPINFKKVNDDFDIVLINNDCQINNDFSKTIYDTELKVRYTKSFIKKGAGFIDLSLIPILLKYLLKLKSTFQLVKTHKNKDDSKAIFLKQVAAVIDEHIDDHSLNMERLSDLLNMSRSAFSKKIKRYTGLKPTEHVNAYKLEKSKHLLVITNWQISRISDVLGFSSQHYYCRLFKKKEGLSPLQFRISNKTQ